jgi:hypothetical protein
MSFEYQGPAHELYLEAGGKVYHIGDKVPISREAALYMGLTTNGSHRFAGLDDVAIEDARNAAAAAREDAAVANAAPEPREAKKS